MRWVLLISKPAERDFKKVPKKYIRQVAGALRRMEIDPFGGDFKKIGKNKFRRRVGNWRILFEMRKKEVRVLGIVRRETTTYRKKP